MAPAWFIIDAKQMLDQENQTVIEAKHAAFMERHKLEVKLEDPSGWCGYHCVGTHMKILSCDTPSETQGGLPRIEQTADYLEAATQLLARALREHKTDLAKAIEAETQVCVRSGGRVLITISDSEEEEGDVDLTPQKTRARRQRGHGINNWEAIL